MKRKNRNEGADQGLQHSASANLFDDREKDLIQLILKNSATQSLTTIEDINRILGLSEKSPDLQKKHRSDTIISINKKYGYYTKTENLLLKRYTSVQDKRGFEYFIDYDDYRLLFDEK